MSEFDDSIESILDVAEEDDKKIKESLSEISKNGDVFLSIIAPYVGVKISPSKSATASIGLSEEVGQERKFVVGKYSGRNIIRHYVGDDIDDEKVDYILGKVKDMSAKLKRSLTRDELENVFSQHRKSKS